MKNGNGFMQRVDAFFNGKGFYIVLFICAAVIAAAAWSLIGNRNAEYPENQAEKTADIGMEEGLSAFIGSDAELKIIRPASGEAEVSAEKPEKAMPASAPEHANVTVKPEAEEITEPVSGGGYVWPVSGEISLEYSTDYPVYSKTMADWRTHDGVDIEAEQGALVLAAAAGSVSEVRDDAMLGVTVVIDHGNDIFSSYSGLAGTPTVSAGDAVTMGAVIGSVGNTALSEASEPSHLHFAMTDGGESVNPLDYLP